MPFKNHFRKINFTHVFYFLVIINALPIVMFRYFPTMDGPSHLYNSKIILNLIFHNSNSYNSFFKINHDIIPYWIAHLTLTGLRIFFNFYIAEKILLLIYVIGTPYVFYKLITFINPKNTNFGVILILPFIYNILFYLGFSSFSLSILFYLLTVYYWLKIRTNLNSRKVIILFCLICLTYFSHIIFFVVLLFSTALISFVNYLTKTINFKCFIKESLFLFIAALPSICFLFSFLNSRSFISNEENKYLPSIEILKDIISLKILNVFSITDEIIYSRILFLLLFLLTVIALFKKIKIHESIKFKFSIFDKIWIFLIISILSIIFLIPGSNDYITLRLIIIFFIIYITWLSFQSYSKFINYTLFFITLFVSLSLGYKHFKITSSLNKIAKEFENASNYIEPNSIVLPIKNSDSWFDGHFGNYLGANRNLLIPDNYEASKDYFPVVWNEEEIPNLTIGDSLMSNCLYWKSNFNNKKKTIDYILIWGNNKYNDCLEKIFNYVNSNYELIYTSESAYIKLYKYANLTKNPEDSYYRKLIYYKNKIYQTPEWFECIKNYSKTNNVSIEQSARENAIYTIKMENK